VEELDGLASSLAAGVGDVRGCLIVSRDGLVVDSYPESGEMEARHAWTRLGALGDPERGFAQFASETWCFVRRGPYAAFAIVGPGARPGLVIDQMEQVLLAAEQTRAKPPEARQPGGHAPTIEPRTPLHPESLPDDEPVVIPGETRASVAVPIASVKRSGAADGDGAYEGKVAVDRGVGARDLSEAGRPEERANPPGRRLGADGAGEPEPGDPAHPDVDRFSLAREFGQLLQDDEAVADG